MDAKLDGSPHVTDVRAQKQQPAQKMCGPFFGGKAPHEKTLARQQKKS